MKKKRRTSPEEFILIWQSAKDVNEVAKKCGATAAVVSTKACNYRKKGVPLKRFNPPGRPAFDWEALAEFAESLEDAGEEEKDSDSPGYEATNDAMDALTEAMNPYGSENVQGLLEFGKDST